MAIPTVTAGIFQLTAEVQGNAGLLITVAYLLLSFCKHTGVGGSPAVAELAQAKTGRRPSVSEAVAGLIKGHFFVESSQVI